MEVLRKERWAIDRQKVCSAYHTLEMNNAESTAPVAIQLWLYNPQPGVFIRLVARN